MRRGNSVILIVAVLMGLAAVYLARDWIQRQPSAAAAAPPGTIVVAAAPLGFGTEVTRDNTAEIPWAAEKLPEGAFASKAELLNEGRRVVLAPMQRSELILRNKVTGPGQRASLSAVLEEGRKAVTVRVDDVRGVAGFVLPGDRVDVVLIRMENRAANQTESTSDVLVQHVKVLAVDQIINERQEKPTIAKAVTLEVTTEEAQKILLASNVGRLSLILRHAGEAQPERSQRITDKDLGFTPVPVTRTAAPPPARNMATVDIVRGAKREQYKVERSAR